MLGQFCDDVELACQVMRLRSLVMGKITIFMEAIIEIVDWELLSCLILTDQVGASLKAAILVLLRVTG